MHDFIKAEGLSFLPHLLRRLSDDFVKNLAAWYEEIGGKAPPRTHSTMRVLARNGPTSLTEVAALLRQSHPLVITWVRQLKALGFVYTTTDPADGRRTILNLTDAGKAELKKHQEADRVLHAALERLMTEADARVFEGLWRMEQACRTETFLNRLRQEADRLQFQDS